MTEKKDKGDFGEQRAQAYLRSCGYKILTVNWRHKHVEADIIMKDGDILVFVEVKTRSSLRYGYPEESVNYAKQKNMVRLANVYLAKYGHEGEVRFDIVSVLSQEEVKIEHIKDAFWHY
ncbi:YraN family protein [Sphingobacterium sp. lm-10]|uniref:YraN family protein n=1 Tax=Sphingobacterium sp. lm-10 TaxID=2944904 RepID=UPI00201FD838|nr:YraN family protein [Sphingobacterium sp. lm-10]MCL7988684.1 YraN family protein [Sphingobacterium sp. lm-10]